MLLFLVGVIFFTFILVRKSPEILNFLKLICKRKAPFHIFKIGISGKIGSGKSTLADNLEKLFLERNFMVYQRNFADELKQFVAQQYQFDVSLCYDQQGKNKIVKNGKTVGQLLQEVGTAKREIDANFWVQAVDLYIGQKSSADAIEQLVSKGYQGVFFIISDVRFENEANWLGDQLLVRLEGDPGNIAAQTNRNKMHISETALDDYKFFDLVLNTEIYDAGECAKKVFECFSNKITL